MTEVMRVARPADAEAIARVLAAAFAPYRAQYTPEGYAATTPSAAGVVARMASATTLVTLTDDRIVATASYREQPQALYVLGMAVHPEFHGRGLARGLLNTIESHALQLEKSRLLLSTTPFLDGAIALYRKHGFARVPDSDHDLHGTPLFDMVKDL